MFQGISASPGIAMGKAYLINEDKIDIQKEDAPNSDLEMAKFQEARDNSAQEIQKIKEITFAKMGKEKSDIFEAHLLLLNDPEIIKQTQNLVIKEKVTSLWAIDQISKNFIALFESMDDEYMKERAADIKDVFTRVKRHLLGLKTQDLSLIDQDVILVSHDLTPSQTAIMNKKFVLGFITDVGGKTSHSAIMARTMEIPAVVGVENISQIIKDDDILIFDGSTGDVFINPDDKTIKKYEVLKDSEKKQRKELDELLGQESITLDGHHVEIAGNIGTLHDLDSFEKNDAESVGLYRTEFLFMDRTSMPSEQEQFEAYTKIIKRLDGKQCIIRTLDIGGDKKLDYLDIGQEENPFLGYRAIRICLNQPEIFKPQLRALLRASVFGPIGIMFPMISSLEELLDAKRILQECKDELKLEGSEFSDNILTGMMIEVPSAALMTDILAKHVDFFSIGTNDLTQYSCAVDRMNEKIEKLYNPFHPGLLRLIHMTIKNAKDHNIMPAMCGSMAHIPELVPLFLGMGLHEFSMSPMHVLPTRKLIRSLNYKECTEIVEKVLQCGSAQEVKTSLQDFLRAKNLRE